MGSDVTLGMALLLAALGAGSGLLGALVGIGGGVVIVPSLVIGLGVSMQDAVAISLVSVVATSTAAGSVYVKEGLANMRLGMTLEIATTLGGMSGGLVAVVVSPSILAALFAAMLVVTAALLVRGKDPSHHAARGAHASGADATPEEEPRGWEERGTLAGAYHDTAFGKLVAYRAERLGFGSSVAFVAGAMSGLLGVGGGFLKVPAMTLGMRVPLRVAAATSNFMIGVTAISSLTVYVARGYLRPMLAVPLVVGVIGGSLAGTKLGHRVSVRWLRVILAVVLVGVAVEMAMRAWKELHGG